MWCVLDIIIHPVKWALVWTNMEAEIHPRVSIVDGGEAPRGGEFDGRAHAEGSLWRGWKLVPRKQRSDNMSWIWFVTDWRVWWEKMSRRNTQTCEAIWVVTFDISWGPLRARNQARCMQIWLEKIGILPWLDSNDMVLPFVAELRVTKIYLCIQATRHQMSQYAIRITWSIQQRCRAIE